MKKTVPLKKKTGSSFRGTDNNLLPTGRRMRNLFSKVSLPRGERLLLDPTLSLDKTHIHPITFLPFMVGRLNLILVFPFQSLIGSVT
jgi:hypothetical protein